LLGIIALLSHIVRDLNNEHMNNIGHVSIVFE